VSKIPRWWRSVGWVWAVRCDSDDVAALPVIVDGGSNSDCS
jgi:hypothetical protein